MADHHMADHHTAASEIPQSHTAWSNGYGPERGRRMALLNLELHATTTINLLLFTTSKWFCLSGLFSQKLLQLDWVHHWCFEEESLGTADAACFSGWMPFLSLTSARFIIRSSASWFLGYALR